MLLAGREFSIRTLVSTGIPAHAHRRRRRLHDDGLCFHQFAVLQRGLDSKKSRKLRWNAPTLRLFLSDSRSVVLLSTPAVEVEIFSTKPQEFSVKVVL